LDAAVALIYQLIPSAFFLCSPTYQFLHRYEFWTFLQPGSCLQISIVRRRKAAPEHIWLHWQNSPVAIQPHADHQNLESYQKFVAIFSSAWLLPQEQPSPLGRDIAKI